MGEVFDLIQASLPEVIGGLVVAAIVAVISRKTWRWWNRNHQNQAEDRARGDTLQRYLDTMQELILDKGLKKSEKDAEIRDVARVQTLAVLRSLEGNRKGQVVRFLYEADLIGKSVAVGETGERQVTEAIIDLRDADLSFADLRRANLIGADLTGALLAHADLTRVNLSYTNLSGSDMRAVKVIPNHLQFYDLSNFSRSILGANLSHANLTDASLLNADLRLANLCYANLTGAMLFGADLRYADLTGATVPRWFRIHHA